jgi:hypothetical protein
MARTRVRANYVFGVTDAALTNSGTTMSAPALARLPAIGSTQVAALTLYDPSTSAFEIVYVSAHTASATTATIERGKEGCTAQAWPSGVSWLHGPTAMEARESETFSLVYENTGDTIAGFSTVNGTWSTDGTVISQTATSINAAWLVYTAGVLPVGMSIFEADVRVNAGTDSAGIVIGANTNINGGGALGRLTIGTPNKVVIEQATVSGRSSANFAWTTGTWYKLRLATAGGLASLFVDGVLMTTAGNNTVNINDAGGIALLTQNNTASFRNLKFWRSRLPGEAALI